jgi:hypothetical protein
LVIRIWAIYARHKPLLIFLGVFGCLQLAATATIMGISVTRGVRESTVSIFQFVQYSHICIQPFLSRSLASLFASLQPHREDNIYEHSHSTISMSKQLFCGLLDPYLDLRIHPFRSDFDQRGAKFPSDQCFCSFRSKWAGCSKHFGPRFGHILLHVSILSRSDLWLTTKSSTALRLSIPGMRPSGFGPT